MAIIEAILRGFALTLNKQLFLQICKKNAGTMAGVYSLVYQASSVKKGCWHSSGMRR
ncbi:hypothetical protein LEI94_18230 [Salmonella enterica]|nr:hypothetical protein [Salmonella enterica]